MTLLADPLHDHTFRVEINGVDQRFRAFTSITDAAAAILESGARPSRCLVTGYPSGLRREAEAVLNAQQTAWASGIIDHALTPAGQMEAFRASLTVPNDAAASAPPKATE